MSASDNDHASELLIQEVDEELRREQFLKLWQRYGTYIVAVVVAVVLAVAGYQGWRSWQSHVRQEESARFAAALTLIGDGKTDAAVEALEKLGAEGHSGYGVAATMAEAEVKIHSGDVAGATAAYERLVSSGAPAVFRDLARLKLALLALEKGDTAGAEARLGDLTMTSDPWHFSALEAMAMVALKKGDTKRAVELYRQLADDLKAPAGIRARAAEMLATPDLSSGNNAPAPAASEARPAEKVKD